MHTGIDMKRCSFTLAVITIFLAAAQCSGQKGLERLEPDAVFRDTENALRANFFAGPSAELPRRHLLAGRRSYRKYQRSAGPALLPAVSGAPDPLWFAVQIDGVEVFMMDTRTERAPREITEQSTCFQPRCSRRCFERRARQRLRGFGRRRLPVFEPPWASRLLNAPLIR